jgi:hypothetical protein
VPSGVFDSSRFEVSYHPTPEQLLEDIERRQEVAARIGIGFEIPEPSFVPNVPKTPELEAVGVAA